MRRDLGCAKIGMSGPILGGPGPPAAALPDTFRRSRETPLSRPADLLPALIGAPAPKLPLRPPTLQRDIFALDIPLSIPNLEQMRNRRIFWAAAMRDLQQAHPPAGVHEERLRAVAGLRGV